MKRLLIILGVLLALTLGVQAQDVTVSKNATNFNVTLTAADTVSDNSTTISKVIGLRAKGAVQLYSIQLSLTKVSGTPTAAWVLAGSMDGTYYADIDTVNWAGSAADTTIIWTDISTGVAWPYMRVKGTEGGTAKTLVAKLIGRFIDKVR